MRELLQNVKVLHCVSIDGPHRFIEGVAVWEGDLPDLGLHPLGQIFNGKLQIVLLIISVSRVVVD